MYASIAIARRWLSKCGANVVACIQRVVAKIFFTNFEALGDIRISKFFAPLFKNSLDPYMLRSNLFDTLQFKIRKYLKLQQKQKIFQTIMDVGSRGAVQCGATRSSFF